MTRVEELFFRWARCEIASHYAQPCPDEVMDQLVGDTSVCMEQLAATPAESLADVALKMLPPLLYEYEPKAGDPPLIPNPESASSDDRGLIASILADLGQHAPEVALLLNTPHYSARRRIGVAA
jgi:hypothetical protein